LIENHLPFVLIEELVELFRNLRDDKQLAVAGNLKFEQKEVAVICTKGIWIFKE